MRMSGDISCCWTRGSRRNARVSHSTSLGMTNRLYVIPPVYVGEKVIAPFAIAQNCFIEMVRRELIMQSIETSKVILRPFRGVLLCGSCLHQERPIARLCQ